MQLNVIITFFPTFTHFALSSSPDCLLFLSFRNKNISEKINKWKRYLFIYLLITYFNLFLLFHIIRLIRTLIVVDSIILLIVKIESFLRNSFNYISLLSCMRLVVVILIVIIITPDEKTLIYSLCLVRCTLSFARRTRKGSFISFRFPIYSFIPYQWIVSIWYNFTLTAAVISIN